MNTTGLLIGILVAAAVAVTAFLVLSSGRTRKRYREVPPALRPGYSDDQLEKSVLERWMAWGLVLTAFFAVGFPVYWVFEERRIQETEQSLFVASVAEGEELYAANCAECHGGNAGGGAAPSPYGDESWPAPNLRNIVERYEDSTIVDDVREHIITTLEFGRPGTPMPTYGMAFQGPFTDQEIEEVTDWILTQQDPPEDVNGEEENGEEAEDEAEEGNGEEAEEENGEEAEEENGEEAEEETAEAAGTEGSVDSDASGEELFAANCANCHGPEGQGRVGPSLVGVFERHDEDSILGILRNGIYMAGTHMPSFQQGWFYEEARYDDETLERIVDYLGELQPDEVGEEFQEYQTPGVERDPGGAPEEPDEGDEDEGDGDQTAQAGR